MAQIRLTKFLKLLQTKSMPNFQTKDGLAPKFIFETFSAITRGAPPPILKKFFALKGLGHEMDWKATPK
jgi:hypothetical protein